MGGKPRLDLNVEAAWAQGATGKNVTTAIMDDGECWESVTVMDGLKKPLLILQVSIICTQI